jgi:hypothetical protein
VKGRVNCEDVNVKSGAVKVVKVVKECSECCSDLEVAKSSFAVIIGLKFSNSPLGHNNTPSPPSLYLLIFRSPHIT